jgi:hypothetical protein
MAGACQYSDQAHRFISGTFDKNLMLPLPVLEGQQAGKHSFP